MSVLKNLSGVPLAWVTCGDIFDHYLLLRLLIINNLSYYLESYTLAGKLLAVRGTVLLEKES